MHLITKEFMPNYMIWSMHEEVGEKNDDVTMPDVAQHKAITN
jgi:hypothetical protein